MSFHTATDAMVRSFEVPVGGTLGSTFEVKDKATTSVGFKYHINRLYQGVELKKGSVSHSEGVKEMALMQKLLDNLQQYSAFEIALP
jgi:hypothetical protein